MEQLRLLEVERAGPSMIDLDQELRKKLVQEMSQAIVMVFKAQKEGRHESTVSQDSE